MSFNNLQNDFNCLGVLNLSNIPQEIKNDYYTHYLGDVNAHSSISFNGQHLNNTHHLIDPINQTNGQAPELSQKGHDYLIDQCKRCMANRANNHFSELEHTDSLFLIINFKYTVTLTAHGCPSNHIFGFEMLATGSVIKLTPKDEGPTLKYHPIPKRVTRVSRNLKQNQHRTPAMTN